MKRGDLVKAVYQGDYGKPRPWLVVQSERLAGLNSVIMCPLTTALETKGATRVEIAPSAQNGLKAISLVMVDKITAVPTAKCRERIGSAEPAILNIVDERLALAVGLLG